MNEYKKNIMFSKIFHCNSNYTQVLKLLFSSWKNRRLVYLKYDT